MKRAILLGFLLLTLFTGNIFAMEKQMDIDLLQGSINKIPLLGPQFSHEDIRKTLGEPTCESHSFAGDTIWEYRELGLEIEFVPGHLTNLSIYFMKFVKGKNCELQPYSGKVTYGISGNTDMEEIMELFKDYTNDCIFDGEINKCYRFDLRTHTIYFSFSSKSKRLTELMLKPR